VVGQGVDFTNGQTINHAWNATLNTNGSSITATNV
jgi:hypothetical protein